MAGEYDEAVCPLAASGGGLAVPKRTSKLVAFAALQVSVGVKLTPVAALAGEGEVGVPGSGRLAAVEKDQTGPVVVPELFLATICQK